MDQKIKANNVDLMYPAETEKVKCYMRIIIKDLEDQYNGDIPAVLIFSLDMMVDLLRVYFKAQKEMLGQKVVVGGDGSGAGIVRINPLVHIIQDTNKQIIALAEKLGLTMFSKEKIKIIKQRADDTSDNKTKAQKELFDKLTKNNLKK